MAPLPAAELRDLAARVLVRAGASAANAEAVAVALVRAELDGIPSHGLSRLPFYADQAKSGKVDGGAVPEVVRVAPAALRVDARHGFAYPAIEAAVAALPPVVAETGVAAAAIHASHHCGVAGHHVERLAEQGLLALLFANTPAAIAPHGGARPLFGTDPVAFACPRRAAPPIVVDLSLSVAARGRILLAAQRGEPIPPGCALDVAGRPTIDAGAALGGTLLPIGGAKGAALALMVELLAAALTGSHYGFEASSFFDAEGPPPSVGQLILAVDPVRLAGPGFLDRIEALVEAMLADPGVRLPGARRRAARERLGRTGIEVPAALLAELRRRAAP
jgi:(2R)-3-sulfolactate dehydrogenase (NADP+)